MSDRNGQPGHLRAAVARARMLDRLFLGGCIATYIVLMVAVVAALKAYGI